MSNTTTARPVRRMDATRPAATTPTTSPASSPVPRWALIAVMALFLSSSTVLASGSTILQQANNPDAVSHFGSAAAALTFLRVTAGAWAVAFSLLQAVIMKLLVRGLEPTSKLRISRSWLWVLIGQVPMMIAIYATRMIGGQDALNHFTTWGVRAGFGALSAVIFTVLAHQSGTVTRSRATIIAAVAILLNTAMLMMAR